jgi:hypothetical protein
MEETQSKMWFSGIAHPVTYAGRHLCVAHRRARRSFWIAAGVLLGGCILYAPIDSLTSRLPRRVYARKRTDDRMRKVFEDNNVPMRRYLSQYGCTLTASGKTIGS